MFTKAVEKWLLEGKAQVAVHSLKDLPTEIDPALQLSAIPDLEDREDVVIISDENVAKGIKTLADLPAGSLVGTSSLRRLSMLKFKYPGLKVMDCRGNLNTRLKKLNEGM